ncbi:hypothetical protein L3I75_004553 [Vibrio vulnificus]|nr:hypothetical protein [Vibrio vulnificus]EIU7865335.1 hypothetical protein [Vibrio vulnificus]EJE8581393.1 hypothetical protein [Vibrio vulnificus]
MKIIKDWTNSVKKQFEQRLSNPLLGSFSISWVFFNWKAIAFLLFSEQSIENKLKVIESDYSSLNYVLWFPLASSIVLTIALPWVSLLIQLSQDVVNTKRTEKQSKYDAKILLSKTQVVTAETQLDNIKKRAEIELEYQRKSNELELEHRSKLKAHELETEKRSLEFDLKEREQRNQIDLEREKRVSEMELEERKQDHKFRMEMEKEDRERSYQDHRDQRSHELEMRKLEVTTRSAVAA